MVHIMSLFKDMLKSDETLFKNAVALEYDYIPKLVPYREAEQRKIASCIKPLFQNRNGRNLIIFGSPGIGKTVACKHVLTELEEETDDIHVVFVNCWQKNTSYKVLVDMCEQLGYKFTQNKKTDELFKIVKNIVNKKAAVFAFDEIDKVEDHDFLYSILEEIYNKTIILITNFKEFSVNLDARIKSRLVPEIMEFKHYNLAETRGILEQRKESAFYDGVWENELFDKIVQKTFEMSDIRVGLYLLKEAANEAENDSSRKVLAKHVDSALSKSDDFSAKSKSSLEDDSKFILEIIKKNSGKKSGEVFRLYQQEGGDGNYKAFQRKIKKLADDGFITTEKITGGSEGTTTIIRYSGTKTKKITDF